MKKEELVVAVVGLGSIGRRHLKNLDHLGVKRLIGVTKGRCPLPQDELPAYQGVQTLSEALSLGANTIVVANPTAMHLETALKAASAGCHILLEKPVHNTLKGVEELNKLVESKNLVCQIGFQFRFHPVLREIKRRVDDNQIGKIASVGVEWGEYLPAWHPWEDYRKSYSARLDLGGGVLLTLCHPFDYLNWIFGPGKVITSMWSSDTLDIEAEDSAVTLLQYPKGIIGSIKLDYLQRPPVHNMSIVGEKGKIIWNNEPGIAKIWTEGRMDEICPPSNFTRNDLFIAELQAFIECIEGTADNLCPLNDGIICLQQVLEARKMGGSETK